MIFLIKKYNPLFLAFIILSFQALNYPLIKICLSSVPPFFFLGIRFLLTGLIFFPFVNFSHIKLLPLFQISFILNVVHYGANYLSFKYMSPSVIALIQQTQIPFLILFLIILRGLKKNSVPYLGIVLTFLGVFTIYGLSDFKIIGLFYAFTSSISWAFAQILQKKYHYDFSSFVFFTSIFSVPFLFFISFISKENIHLEFNDFRNVVYLLIYQILILGIGIGLWKHLIFTEKEKLSVSFIVLLKPLLIIFFDTLILKQNIIFSSYVGFIFIIIGTTLCIRKSDSKLNPWNNYKK